MIRILALCSPGEVRVAVVAGRMLEEYAIWRPGRPDGMGDVYRARVAAHVPSLAGAFVALPGGASGFLPDSEGAAGAVEGQAITVRVTRAAQGGKGPRLSAKLPQEPGPVGLVRPGEGALEELAARYPDAPVLIDDAALAASLPALAGRISVVGSALDEDVADQIEALAHREVALPGGMRASIDPTPALVAIDVDTGAASAGRQPKAAAQRAANTAALPALARQIRLRNLSGAILIDLAGMSIKQRSTLGPALAAALAADPARPRFLGFTALGLAEITRPRLRPPLHELLAGPHASGLAALRQIAADSAAAPYARLALHAAPDVLAALESDAVARSDLARRTGRALISVPDPALPPGRWRIEREDGDALLPNLR